MLQVLDAIYGIIGHEDALDRMLAGLAAHFNCPSAALVYLDPGRPMANVEAGHGLFDAPARARYRAEFASIDPAPAALARLRIGEAAATDRIFTPQQRAESRFLTEFYQPLGLCEAMGAPIATEGGRFGLVAVHRGPERPAFDDGEIETFAALAVHIGRAIDLRRRFFAMAGAVDKLETALDTVDGGLMVFDPHGRLDHANAAARAMIARGDGLFLTRSGHLGALDIGAAKALRATMSPQNVARKPMVVIVPRPQGAPNYIARLLPQDSLDGAGWRVHIADLDGTIRNDAGAPLLLKQALGVTEAGAQLIAALLEGHDVKSYATKSGLSSNTVRFHLKAAFKATGVSRQAELIKLALRIVKDLGL